LSNYSASATSLSSWLKYSRFAVKI
jgi:hypothetical protein